LVSGHAFGHAAIAALLERLQAAVKQRLVSGYRFSDTETTSKSDAPFRGLNIESLLAQEKQNPPCQRFWRVGQLPQSN